MGCDIHGVVEKFHGDKWVAFRTLNSINSIYERDDGRRWHFPVALSRNYERFAALAGVRGDGPAAKGLPDDASETARMLFKVEGDHTPSWMPIDEACRIFLETERYKIEDFDKKYPASFYFGIEDTDTRPYRLVFWFDS
jgi:hypothetical protein